MSKTSLLITSSAAPALLSVRSLLFIVALASIAFLQACGDKEASAPAGTAASAPPPVIAAVTAEERPLEMVIQVYRQSADETQLPPIRLFRPATVSPQGNGALSEVPLQSMPLQQGDAKMHFAASAMCGMKWAGRCYAYSPPCTTTCN